MKKLLKGMAIACIFVIAVAAMINLVVVKGTEKYIYTDLSKVPHKKTVIVLGALVNGNKLSPVLEDRVVLGVKLYETGKAQKILLSGDHGRKNYDEVNGMRKYILTGKAAVKPEDIFMDHAGFDTYDSMYRAKEVFGVDSVIIVTQKFHINRAVYIARKLGIDAVGVSLSEDQYPAKMQLKWEMREYISRIKAFGDILIHSKPKYLGEKIPITGDGRMSWDEDK